MAFQLSPGVNVSEIDLTTIVPVLGVSAAAYAGAFRWGPVEEVQTISDENELIRQFGLPDGNTFVSFFSVANFLSYSNNIKVVRASSNTSSKNATEHGNGLYIKNETDYLDNHSNGANTNGAFAAKYPSDLGNSLGVSIFCGSSNTDSFNAWAYKGFFDSVPTTTTWASAKGSANDEMHIVVLDTNGVWSGTKNTVLERFQSVSKASDAKSDDGTSLYYKNVLNDRSKYIWWLSHPEKEDVAANTWGVAASANIDFNVTEGNVFNDTYGNTSVTISLANGTFSMPASNAVIQAYDLFKNADEIDADLIITGSANSVVVAHIIDNIAESRKDCVVFCSPPLNAVVDNLGEEVDDIKTYRNSTLNKNSSYAVMDSGWKYQFDKYNNTYRWIPLNADIAGLCARTDELRDPWWSPAGLNRGIIKNAVKLAWNPDKTDRDELYKIGVNPVVSFLGQGNLLFGDKTLLAKPSAFDRINVRRLFIVLEKAIARAAKYSLFEFNDEFTRAAFVSLVEPYLRDVKGRRGIYDFRVVCDASNNTPEVIDRNEFIGDIYIKPARSINFIQLNFVAVRTGVAFEEVVGKF